MDKETRDLMIDVQIALRDCIDRLTEFEAEDLGWLEVVELRLDEALHQEINNRG